jgi:uncharacterized membrane protein YfcA
MQLVNILLALLIIGGIVFGIVFLKDYRSAKAKGKLEPKEKTTVISLIGFFVCFFDALGVGGFAPFTAAFKHFKLVKDRIIPGTLNAAMCIPVITEALIFIKEVPVDMTTLIGMVVAAVFGAVIGAEMVSKLNEKKIQLGMAFALGAVLLIMLAGKIGIMPAAGDATGLTGVKLTIAIFGNFILGALMTLGIGLYAPCMALVYSLGLSPIAAFPIMIGSCAFLLPASSIRFIKRGAYHRRCTMIITITGVVGVVIAAYLVTSLPLGLITWLVMGVIGYTSVKLFLSARRNSQ